MYKLTITEAKHKDRTYEYTPSKLIECIDALFSPEILVDNKPVVVRTLSGYIKSLGILEFKLFNENLETVATAIIEKYKEVD